MKVGIPRALAYYYYLPFYKTFLESLGCETVLSSPTTAGTLERLSVCPTDEPCISVKLAFPHALELLERDVDRLFVPILVSKDRHSYYCPKHMGLSDMLRSGLDLPPGRIIAPQINLRQGSRSTLRSFMKAGRSLGRSAAVARRAFTKALHSQRLFTGLTAEQQLTIPEAYEKYAGIKFFKRKRPYQPAALLNRDLRIGVAGHSYILYDYIAHNIVDRLREYATVLVPEMVSPGSIRESLSRTPYGAALWSFEQAIVGSALYWLRHSLVDSMILLAPFECGPEAVIEVFLEEEAAARRIPFLILTVDEQTGEAGLVTRLEAFLDTVRDQPRGYKRTAPQPGERKRLYPVIAPLPEKRVLGFPNLGNLGPALATVFSDELVSAVAPLPVTRRTAELGEELSPEFICYPFAVTMGQMRQCLEAGANTIIMVGGKGRCRLGWYAELQEILLKRAGYSFEMLSLDSPFPLRENCGPFIQTLRSFYKPGLGRKIVARALLAFYKALLTEEAEAHFYRLQARESMRGGAFAIFRRFIQGLPEISAFTSLRGSYRDFRSRCSELPLDNWARPLKVRLIGEIYAVFEEYVNRELARTLGSLPDIRIEVQREITVMNWLRHNIIKSPALMARYCKINAAARPYLEVPVGGHGRDSIGLAALAPKEGIDGIIHLWPFTCMPEIVAQSILTRLGLELGMPLLTVIVNEQTGQAGLKTRLESFAHVLEERRAGRGGKVPSIL